MSVASVLVGGKWCLTTPEGVLPSTFIHWPPITTTKALSAAQLVKRCEDNCEAAL